MLPPNGVVPRTYTAARTTTRSTGWPQQGHLIQRHRGLPVPGRRWRPRPRGRSTTGPTEHLGSTDVRADPHAPPAAARGQGPGRRPGRGGACPRSAGARRLPARSAARRRSCADGEDWRVLGTDADPGPGGAGPLGVAGRAAVPVRVGGSAAVARTGPAGRAGRRRTGCRRCSRWRGSGRCRCRSRSRSRCLLAVAVGVAAGREGVRGAGSGHRPAGDRPARVGEVSAAGVHLQAVRELGVHPVLAARRPRGSRPRSATA